MVVHSALLNVMMGAAEKAARSLRRNFSEVEALQVSAKGPADFVSSADLKAERIIRESLEKARPNYGFLLEESGAIPGKDLHHRWIVDPLDGTSNFLHGVPHFAISIALERDGEIIAGIVQDPIKNETFWAEKGMGAWLEDRRLRVSTRRKLPEALVATGIPFRGHGDQVEFLTQLAAVMGEVSGIRRFGAAALDLAYVAAGRYDGYWERHLQPWDVAAGILLVREAGGYVTDIDGSAKPLQSDNILASNGYLHDSMGVLLRSKGSN